MRELLFSLTAAVRLAYAALVGGPMDGTAWEVKLKPDSLLSLSHREILSFERGRLKVSGYFADGFSPALYTVQDTEGEAETLFSASLTGAQDQILTWQGLVTGDSVRGIAVLWAKDAKPRWFIFKGSHKSR